MACSYSAGEACLTEARSFPSIGDTLPPSFPLPIHSPQKTPGLAGFRPSRLKREAIVPRVLVLLEDDFDMGGWRVSGLKAGAFGIHDAQSGFDGVILEVQHRAEPDGPFAGTQDEQAEFKSALPKRIAPRGVREGECD